MLRFKLLKKISKHVPIVYCSHNQEYNFQKDIKMVSLSINHTSGSNFLTDIICRDVACNVLHTSIKNEKRSPRETLSTNIIKVAIFSYYLTVKQVTTLCA